MATLSSSDGVTDAWPSAASRRADLAGRAGALAALLMLFVQLLWRLFWSSTGVQSFPEFVVAAIARLTPLGVFGFATENFGSLAKNTLFVVVLIAIVAVGYEAGEVAARLSAAGRFGRGAGGRIAGGMVVSAALLLFTLVVVLPIARLGLFALDSPHAAEIMVQLVATFALFGVAWALLTDAFTAETTAAETAAAAVSRRAVLERAVFGGGALALLAGVGGLSWRLITPRPKGDVAASEQAAREIAATAEARSAAQVAAVAPTSAPVPELRIGGAEAAPGAPNEAAGSAAEAAPAVAPTLFATLEADGRLTPKLTAVADFYHVSKNLLDPSVDGDGWTLTVGGLVEHPLTIAYEDLVKRATTRKITTLCCISNELNGDLISTAEWTGIPLAELLAEAAVKPETVDLKFTCADDYQDSIPLARGMDPDTLVVVAMNGEPLPPDHGYPARLIVPGIYGMKNVKWVERIEAVNEDFQGYWQTRGWSDAAPYQIWGRIDSPQSGDKLQPGPTTAAGLASAGDRGINRVEVSLDGGETWADADLEPAINPPFTWVRWLHQFDATPGRLQIVIRVTDGEGNVAPEQRRPPLPDGATGWPSRTVSVQG